MQFLRFTFSCYLVLLLMGWVSGDVSGQLPPGFIRYPVAQDLNPTSMTLAPDGSVYVTEKNGRILVIRDGELLPQPLLRIPVDSANERGLGHMVLHPEFEDNGYYYVYYTVPGVRHNRVSRFTANGDHTVPGSERVILDLDPTGADIHNGGAMLFGPDGYLYIGTGDGAQNWRGEDLGSTNAKILRVTDLGEAVPDNPWFDLGYLRCNLVYAYGLRNPYTMSMDPATGDIFINDVGAFTWEEINRLERGAFFGWPKVEGPRVQQPVPDEYRDPVFAYKHENNFCAVVGGTFYSPAVATFPPEYVGKYFFSDYCTGAIRVLDPLTGQVTGTFMQDGNRVIDLQAAPDGSLYYLERRGLGDGSQEDNTGSTNGILWKVEYTGSGSPFISVPPESTKVVVGESAAFRVQASGSEPLTYTWTLNGEIIPGTEGPEFTIPSASIGMDSARIRVTVSNSEGSRESEPAILRVTTNQRPEPVITRPLTGSRYRAGDTLDFAGYALDPEEGLVPAERLSWRIDFHHGTHSHPAMNPMSGSASGAWVIPQLGEVSTDVWYRIILTATDEDGLAKTVYADVFPEFGSVRVTSDPPGRTVSLDGMERITPFSFDGVQGVSRYLSPPLKEEAEDSVYFFAEWSDGSRILNREVRPSLDEQVFTAEFDGVRKGNGTGLTAYYYPNTEGEGDPVVVSTSPTIDFQFLLQSPHPDVDPDHFSIRWKGYIEPLRTGVHTFTAYFDDNFRLSIDGTVLIDDSEPGPGYTTATKYLEAGRLYPLEVFFAELEWSAYATLKWAHFSFPDETIPTAQLYPDDYLSSADAMGVLGIRVLNGQALEILTESYRDGSVQLVITDVTGRYWVVPDVAIPSARRAIPVDISFLPPGLYYLTATDSRTRQKNTRPFVKAR